MPYPLVLVIDPDAVSRDSLAARLTSLPCHVASGTSFEEGRSILLEVEPAILVAPLKLGQYNGIQLALTARDRQLHTQVIILGYDDPVLQREAERAGAVYLVHPTPDTIVNAVKVALGKVRRWPRARVALHAEVAAMPARVVDVSYEGIRLETPSPAIELNAPVPVVIGGLRISATPVWFKRNDTSVYGAMLAVPPDTEAAWHALVDAALQGGV